MKKSLILSFLSCMLLFSCSSNPQSENNSGHPTNEETPLNDNDSEDSSPSDDSDKPNPSDESGEPGSSTDTGEGEHNPDEEPETPPAPEHKQYFYLKLNNDYFLMTLNPKNSSEYYCSTVLYTGDKFSFLLTDEENGFNSGMTYGKQYVKSNDLISNNYFVLRDDGSIGVVVTGEYHLYFDLKTSNFGLWIECDQEYWATMSSTSTDSSISLSFIRENNVNQYEHVGINLTSMNHYKFSIRDVDFRVVMGNEFTRDHIYPESDGSFSIIYTGSYNLYFCLSKEEKKEVTLYVDYSETLIGYYMRVDSQVFLFKYVEFDDICGTEYTVNNVRISKINTFIPLWESSGPGKTDKPITPTIETRFESDYGAIIYNNYLYFIHEGIYDISFFPSRRTVLVTYLSPLPLEDDTNFSVKLYNNYDGYKGQYDFVEIPSTKAGYTKEFVSCDNSKNPVYIPFNEFTKFEMYLNSQKHFRDFNVPRGDYENFIENNIYLDDDSNYYFNIRYWAGKNNSVPQGFGAKIHIFVTEEGTMDLWCDSPEFDTYWGYCDFNTYCYVPVEKPRNQVFFYGWSKSGNTETVYDVTAYNDGSRLYASFKTEIDGILVGELKAGETVLKSDWSNVLRKTQDLDAYHYDRSEIYPKVFWPKYYARELHVIFEENINGDYWASPNIYLWHEPDKKQASSWPGESITKYAEKMGDYRYRITFPEEYNYCIFNYQYRGNTIQTDDLSIEELISQYGYIRVYRDGQVIGYNSDRLIYD